MLSTAREQLALGAVRAGLGYHFGHSFRRRSQGLDAQVCHVWKIRDGKITSFQQYTDTGQWQDAADPR